MVDIGGEMDDGETVKGQHGTASTKAELTKKALEQWADFKVTYNKTYRNMRDEELHRQAFVKTLIRVERHNLLMRKGLRTVELGINHMADMIPDEQHASPGFRSSLNDRHRAKASSRFAALPSAVNIPDSVDWRAKSIVTRVKNQGTGCNAAWAFSAAGALESAHAISTGRLVELSEQNLIDCNKKSWGCIAGGPRSAFEYVLQTGIDTESSYPYEGVAGTCRFNKSNIGTYEKAYVSLQEGNETALQIAVATIGPVSVKVDAADYIFQYYKTGVYYNHWCSSDRQNAFHAMLVVGYGTDAVEGRYWIVKNSWGPGWGEAGYIRMARNRRNHCGIASAASYPVV